MLSSGVIADSHASVTTVASEPVSARAASRTQSARSSASSATGAPAHAASSSAAAGIRYFDITVGLGRVVVLSCRCNMIHALCDDWIAPGDAQCGGNTDGSREAPERSYPCHARAIQYADRLRRIPIGRANV